MSLVLWVVLFGVGMKSMMGPDMAGGNDASYIAFMAPGIVALSALGGAVAGGSTWLNERLRGIVKEYLAAPIPRLSILAGNALSTVTKALFQGVVIFIVGMLMGTKITGKTKRKFRPNIQTVNALMEDGSVRRVKASTKAIRMGLVIKPLKRKYAYKHEAPAAE